MAFRRRYVANRFTPRNPIGRSERPAFCSSLRPREDMCGRDREEALARLRALEEATRP